MESPLFIIIAQNVHKENELTVLIAVDGLHIQCYHIVTSVLKEEVGVLKTLEELRKDRKMTQAELGVVLGVSQRSVAAYEAGERRPSPETISRIMACFDLTITEAWNMFYNTEDKG